MTPRERLWGMARPLMNAFVAGMPRTLQVTLLSALGRSLRLKRVMSEGANGQFWGSPEDVVVFGEFLRTGRYSPGLVKRLSGFFPEGAGTFLDIGANIGLITVPMARKGVRCFAFEPEPRNFGLLEANLRQNGVEDRVTAMQYAIADGPGQLLLELSDVNFGDNRLVREGTNTGEAAYVPVECRRLDDLLDGKSFEHPLACKVDTQGAEVKVLRGAPRVLAQVDYMVIEFWPAGLRRLGDDAAELAGILEQNFARMEALHSLTNAVMFTGTANETCAYLREFAKSLPRERHLDVVATK